MRLIDYSDSDPAVNLALEEILLDDVEQGRAPNTLRFWESPTPFVVLGTGQALAREVNEENCRADGVPIMRRCSAGGCVLQGPGSLNFSLFLTYAAFPDTAALHRSYRFILGRIAQALAGLGVIVSQAGISDMVVDGRKISGNAQRRRRNALLHHGTLLYQLDIANMERYLREPEEQPDYRDQRPHATFLTVVAISPTDMRCAIAAAFDCSQASKPVGNTLLDAAEALAQEKYRQDTWIRRR